MHEDFPTETPAVVTCGLPYANGDLHVGHLRTYVSGDAYSRALRLLGQSVAFVCGSDMHGTPIAVNAEKEGVSPETFALRYHEQYQETFPAFNIEFDNYGHTHDETNIETTTEFVQSWIDGGHVIEEEIEVAWDAETDQPLPDRFVEGTCPYCGEHARGDECDEGCQRHLEPGEIENPVSTITGNPAEYRTREHKFLKLSDFQSYLQDFIDRLEGTDNAKNQPREWIEGELQDLCITRDMDWGIDYPEAGAEDLVLYVWVDAPIEYVSSTKQYSEQVGTEEYDWEAVWRNQHDGTPPNGGEIVHIIGHDIIQHHTVFWPAMLRGADYNEPRAIMACGFVNLNGESFSTSRNRAVWANDYLESGLDPALYRYHILTGSEFEADVNFSWDGLAERTNSDLVGTLGNFIYRSVLFASRNYGGTPSVSVSDEVSTEISNAMDMITKAVNEYRIRGLGEAPIALARFGNEYIQRHEPWKLIEENPAQAAQVIRDCVQLAKAIAVISYPVMPGKAATLWEQLGETGSLADVTIDAALETPPETFDEPSELFEQIEDETVEDLNEELQARIEEASQESDDTPADEASPEYEPINENRISFEEFTAMDLRIGEIQSVDPIEGADELLKLTVDLGVETRQIVSGLKQLHDLDSLPGKRVVVVANLEKAELFGVESDGMVLAAGPEADLLTTYADSEPGTKVL